MEATLEGEFEKVKCLLDRISWPLAAFGIWPKNMTTSSRLKCTIFLTYFITHLSLELLDLASVMGNLDLVVVNLMVSGFETMALYRILIFRFHKAIPRIINSIEEYLVTERFKDCGEIKILLRYSSIADKFYRVGTRLGTLTTVMYFIKPLQTYVITRIMNGTAVLEIPYRIYHFIDISPIERTAIVYAYQLPMMYMGVAYMTSYSVCLGFVTNLCGQLAILTHRISTTKERDTNHRIIFHQHTKQHIKILILAQWINEAFHLPLLYELAITTGLIGVIVYQFLLNIDDADAFGVFGLLSYIFSLVIIVYVNCYMGERLKTECTALFNAYYECNWYELSPYYKKALIICMQRTQKPIRLTAGKFYIFSLESFLQIMKSSMVYVSMLRKLV